jgi:carboxymethylenebutenolidase
VCHDPDSGPPIPPIAGAAVSHDDLVLEAADGKRFAAVAIDYFGRTAGVGKRGEDFPYKDHFAQTTSASVRADVAAAVAHLRSRDERAAEFRAPVLALMGGADQAISTDDVAVFEAALAAAGVEHEVVTYDGAPDSFFDRRQAEFAGASSDAWRRVLAFLEAHTPA